MILMSRRKVFLLLSVAVTFTASSSDGIGGSIDLARPSNTLGDIRVSDTQVATHFSTLYIPNYLRKRNVEPVAQISAILNRYDVSLTLAVMRLQPYSMFEFVLFTEKIAEMMLKANIAIASIEDFKNQLPSGGPLEKFKKIVTPRYGLQFTASNLKEAWNELSRYSVAWQVIQLFSKLVDIYRPDVYGMSYERKKEIIAELEAKNDEGSPIFMGRPLLSMVSSVILSVDTTSSNIWIVKKALGRFAIALQSMSS